MNRKYILAILTCLMMISSFAIGLLPTIVQAQTWTGPTLEMWGVRVNNPGWGYFGGYTAMWEIIVPALKDAIGIDLETRVVDLDPFDFEAEFYDGWNVSGDPDGDGIRDGWDFATREWWLNPTSHIWLDEMVLSDHVPEWNVMPWMDEDADGLYLDAVKSLNATFQKDHATYKSFMSLWQNEFIENPPVIPIYYANMITGQAAYVDGFDTTAWFYNPRELRINLTTWNDLGPAGLNLIPSTRWGRGADQLLVGMSEDIAMWHPFYTVYYTEEMMNVYTMGMLYRNEREHQNFPTSGEYSVYPALAAEFPTWSTAEARYPGKYPEGYMVATIPIRDGIYWSDGVKFNATDVAFTLNATVNKKAGSFAYADYRGIIKEARVVDELTVNVITYYPRYDLAEYFAHGWAFAMLPYHQFVKWGLDKKPELWDVHVSNTDPIPESAGGAGLERLGPYVPVSSDLPTYPTTVTLQRFDEYVGPNGARLDTNPETGEPYPATPWFWTNIELPPDTDSYAPGRKWGFGLPKEVIVNIVPDDTDRFICLQTLGCDLIDYPVASKGTWDLLVPPLYNVYNETGTPYPALHPLWMNLNNPILSNQYVRLAIAYAIPYQAIFDTIKPKWGIAEVIPGRTFVNPWMEAFDPSIPWFYEDIAKAQQYMWKYWNSLDENTAAGYGLLNNGDPAVYEAGPMGDADVNGFVELADFSVWVDRIGFAPSTYYQYTFPYPATYPKIIDPRVYWPGNNVDPDHDNNDYVELADFSLWVDRLGIYYP